MKRLLAKDMFKQGLRLTPDPDNIEAIIQTWDEAPEFEGDGEEYNILQFGIWRWKKFAIVQWIPDCAAGGISSAPHPRVCSDYFKTFEEARAAALRGEFEI